MIPRFVFIPLLFVMGLKTFAFEVINPPREISPLRQSACWNALEPLNGYEIFCGTEAKDGVLWFVTNEGLISYDGYQCTTHPFPEDFSHRLSTDIFAAPDATFYICNELGFLAYRNKQWNILKRHPENLSHTFPSSMVVASPEGDLLTYFGDTLYKITDENLEPMIRLEERILDVTRFKNEFWIATSSFVYAYQLNGGQLTNRKTHSVDCRDLTYVQQTPLTFATDHESEIWLLGYHKFPLVYDSKSETFVESDIIHAVGENHFLSAEFSTDRSNAVILFGKGITARRHNNNWEILDIGKKMPDHKRFHFHRKNGNLIIGGHGEEVFDIDFSNQRWLMLQNVHFQCEDDNLHQWFLEESGEILEFLPNENQWRRHSIPDFECPNSVQSTSDGTIWVSGGHDNTAAIAYYQQNQWKTDYYPDLTPNIHYLSFLEKTNGEIWFGATGESSEGGGVVVYTPTSELKGFTSEVLKHPRVAPMVSGIAETTDSTWLSGVNIVKTVKNELIPVPISNSKATWIDAIITDDFNNLWVGLWEDGVYKWDGNSWKHFLSSEYIPSKHISNLTYDHHHQRLWIGTKKGISLYSTQSNDWIPDAIAEDVFLPRESATLKTQASGQLWINCASRGWYLRLNNLLTPPKENYFYTRRYTPETHAPMVHILPHATSISESSNIFINWEGVDFWSKTPTERLSYSFRLNHEPWSTFSKNNSQLFFNLSPGDYRLSVRCKDLDGNISTAAATALFEVKPIIYKRPWFILSVTLAVLTIITLLALLVRQRIQSIILMDEFKLQFFTNISHELRTPLTVILGPLQKYLKNENNQTDREPLSLAYKNAQKMLKLVDQILEFRKIELGKTECLYVHGDIIESIQDTIHLVQPLAKDKNQKLSFLYSTPHFETWFEIEKIERIVDNLLLNAIKYTPEGGEITVTVNLTNAATNQLPTKLEFSIEDNGVGIPENKIQHIFEPYIRLKNANMTNTRGTGLGLTFVKSLIDTLGGSVDVVSPVKKSNGTPCGTRFLISLPIHHQNPNVNDDAAPAADASTFVSSPAEDAANSETTPKPKILLVEDDQDILSYLSSELAPFYSVSTAKNGRSAYKKAVKYPPDIIVTDVMMLHMDGRQLCEKIKSTPETSHIPVIMLTALKATEHELHALNKGADDYLVKPVQIDILRSRIANQLRLRNDLRNRFQQQQQLVSSSDEKQMDDTAAVIHPIPKDQFIHRFYQTIKSSYQNPLFDVKLMSEQLRMNRTTLYRKVKSETGKTPSQHIKDFRLQQAASLLKTGKFTVGEVADEVGFTELTYFSTSFKKAFNCTPKDFKETHES